MSTAIAAPASALRRMRSASLLLGPAFVASIAYMDPGNVASNVSAGAKYGYLLVWVVVLANVMAALVQYLSAKVGLVTGRSLPELMRDAAGRRTRVLYWAQAELAAMATDLAEVVGGAIALQLLFRLPLLLGGVITGAVSLALLAVQNRRGQRAFEGVIIGFLAIISIGFVASLMISPPPLGAAAGGMLPRFAGAQSVLLAAAIVGATVMPHVIYLHSGMSRDRHGHHEPGPARARLLRANRWDVGIAMVIAGMVNLAMLLMAAHTLSGRRDINTIQDAYHAVHASLGVTAALLLAIALLASGLASTSVGAYAGAMIMDGLLRRRVSLLLRRLVTLIPALVVLAVGFDPTRALIVSQVVLSFGIPFALIPLVRFTSDRTRMGPDVNHRVTTAIAWVVAAIITALNLFLICLTISGQG
ncbi:Nramp family divalent metal transporter [Nocardia alni]|uniref:Nramp family divalent metal transporter n=1 Tax=Nocardia alni TaxID=2815723 RepID=UPI001C21372B|nr:Nramp family divalent metal transporter [Nocardia alni]